MGFNPHPAVSRRVTPYQLSHGVASRSFQSTPGGVPPGDDVVPVGGILPDSFQSTPGGVPPGDVSDVDIQIVTPCFNPHPAVSRRVTPATAHGKGDHHVSIHTRRCPAG